ncbi:MAG: hypothetical protein ACFFCW_31590, partial [Candidatus Hodarchaeota archaeon]
LRVWIYNMDKIKYNNLEFYDNIKVYIYKRIHSPGTEEKDKPFVELTFNTNGKHIADINKVYDPEFFPYYVVVTVENFTASHIYLHQLDFYYEVDVST